MANETKVIITAETGKAEAAFRTLGGSVDSLSKKMFNLSGYAATLGGALTVTAFSGFIKSSIDMQDELSKLSQKTGASVEALAGLKFAADQNGASLEVIGAAAKKLSSSLADTPELFAQFGVTASDTTGALIQLSGIFASMPDGVEKTALAVKLLGKNGEEMIPFLNQGPAALAEMVEQGKKLYPVTSDSAKAAEAFNDQLSLLQARSAALGINLANGLVPKLSEVVAALDDLSKSGHNFLPIGGIITTVFETIVILGANVGYVFKQIGNEIGGLAAQVVELFTGDWIHGKSNFTAIGDQMKKDAEEARKELDAFEQRILNPPKTTAQLDQATPTTSGKGHDLLKALSPKPAADKAKEESDGLQVLISLEKDYQNELAKRQDALAAPLLSASERKLADDLRNVSKRAQDSRVDLEKLYTSGNLSLATYDARLKDVTKDEDDQRKAIAALSAEQDKLNSSWQYGAKVALQNYLDEAGNVAKQTQALFSDAFKGMEDSLVNFVKTGKLDFSSLADSIITGLIRIQIQQAMVTGLGGIKSWFSSTPTTTTPVPTNLNANGNIFGIGGVQAFALGGAFTNSIVNKPTLFPFANGTGLMGEAGPEAIMPLKRGADGRLGVTVTGGTGGGATVIVNVDASGQSQSGDNDSNLNELGQKIGTLVRGIMLDEMRPGGLLAGSN